MERPVIRIERDLLGEIEVPAFALYGAHTQRAIQNFPLAGQKSIGDYPEMIQSLMIIKMAAASTNSSGGYLEGKKAAAIESAAVAIREGAYADQFPVHGLHGGGGTSANMNANEVLANLAEESLGGQRGAYRIVHPNDDVNRHQSTNDVYPTACHISVLIKWPSLEQALRKLSASLFRAGQRWANVRRIARTCLQDAVDITFSDLFGAYAAYVGRSIARLSEAVDSLHVVNLGGTIVGRADDVPPDYFASVIEELRKHSGDGRYMRAENLFLTAQSPDDLISVSSELESLARGLVKMGKDFRLLGSGPETGFGEICLPPVQAGSSAMPGKVNPVIPEFLIQLCFQVIGMHAACVLALDHGELDLNVWESVIVFNILDSMSLIDKAATTFQEKCVDGLEINAERNRKNSDTIVPFLTRLAKEHSYSEVSEVCKEAGGDLDRLRKLLGEKGLT